jgi:hypothetical protein
MTRLRGALAAAGLAAAPALTAAQEGTAPLALRVPASVRATAMGNAYVAARGSDVVFANPAAVRLVAGLSLSAARYGSASTLGTGATATAIGRVGLAVGVQWLEYAANGAFPASPRDLTERRMVDAASLAVTAALSYPVRGFRVGAAVKYVEERPGAIRVGGTAVDLGLQRDLGRVTTGLAVRNLGSSLSIGALTAEAPTQVALGVMTTRVPLGVWFDLIGATEVTWERDGDLAPAAGFELAYLPLEGWQVALRAGARRVETAGETHPLPVALGGGVTLDRVTVEYAWEPYRGRGAVHRVGLRIE